MAPVLEHHLARRDTLGPDRSSGPLALDIVEAWAQGFNVGSLVILALFLVCNYRKGVLLHKLIVLELVLALGHGFFIFFSNPVYDWFLPITATLLYISYQVHNWVAFLKIRLFLPKWGRWAFIGTLLLVQPYWIVESYASFTFWRQINQVQVTTRPMETFFRDPWWIFTTCWLLYQIKTKYQLKAQTLLQISPRFVVMILCMFLSIVFLIVDLIVTLRDIESTEGVNPYWRLALVFKIAADTIFLDDFKSVLDKIMAHRHGSSISDQTPPPPVPPKGRNSSDTTVRSSTNDTHSTMRTSFSAPVGLSPPIRPSPPMRSVRQSPPVPPKDRAPSNATARSSTDNAHSTLRTSPFLPARPSQFSPPLTTIPPSPVKPLHMTQGGEAPQWR